MRDEGRQNHEGVEGETCPPDSPDPTTAPTLREAGSSAPQTVRDGVGSGRHWGIPRAIAERFAVIQAFEASGAEADAFLVRDGDGRELFAKIYRRGLKPNTKVRERLAEAEVVHVVRCIEAGYDVEAGCHFEILEYAKNGTLADIIRSAPGGLSEVRCRLILRQLHDALSHVHSLGVEHRDLKPENILVRSISPLDLCLTDFGIASAMDATHRFTTTNRTIRYAPPESMAGHVHAGRWDYWSLGMILVEMVTGSHPFDAIDDRVAMSWLTNRSTDELVKHLGESQWRQLCRGLLRRDSRLRWGAEQVQQWLSNPEDGRLTIAQETSASTPQAPPFFFLGKPHLEPAALAESLASHWREGLRLWDEDRPRLLKWLRDELGHQQQGEQVVALGRTGEADRGRQDAQLFALIHILDPSRAPTFRERPLSLDEIRNAANGITAATQADSEWLVAVHDTGVLALAAQLPRTEAKVRALQSSWSSAIARYRELRPSHAPGDGAPPLADLLAACVPGAKAMALFDKKAEMTMRGDAGTRMWYRDLALLPERDAAIAVLLADLAPLAAQECVAERDGRKQRNVHLWNAMTLAGMAGGALAGVWWLLVAGACGGSMEANCSWNDWGRNELDIVSVIFFLAVVGCVFGTLAKVHSQTTGRRNG